MPNLVNLICKGVDDRDPVQEFAVFGQNVLESEELTNKIYSAYLGMITKGWQSHSESGLTRKQYGFSKSDIALLYVVGPYIPCVERMTLTRSIDIRNDGMPGIRVLSGLIPDDKEEDYYIIRPIHRFPQDKVLMSPAAKKFKLLVFTEGKLMQTYIHYFGIKENGDIVSTYDKNSPSPFVEHAASIGYPALVANAWADGKHLWITETAENIGMGGLSEMKMRLGLDKECIKSLFYARSLPLTETGRKRPILHWVRSHQRRIKEGVEVDVSKHLRGITELEMHGLRMRITQPDKAALKGADPEFINEAWRLYGPNQAG